MDIHATMYNVYLICGAVNRQLINSLQKQVGHINLKWVISVALATSTSLMTLHKMLHEYTVINRFLVAHSIVSR